MLELSLLRHFLAVGRAGSFTGAAREMNASQPVISRSIQRLEDVVGTRLLERSTRSVELTPAGLALLSDAEFLLGRAAVALDNARRIGQGGLGRMRIGICPSTESAELARGLADFRAMWPRVNLNLCAVDGSSMLRALRESEVDVGILQTDGSQAEGITARVIASYGLAVAVPAAWGYDQSKAIDLIDLKDRPWLMPARELATVWHDSLVEMCRRAGFEPRIVGTVDDPMSARLMIAGGMGATFFHYKGRRSQQGDISLLKFNDLQVLPPSRTAVAYAEGSNSPQLADFVTCLERTHAAASAPQLVGVME